MRLFTLAAGILCGLALSHIFHIPPIITIGLGLAAVAAAVFARQGGLLITCILIAGIMAGMARGTLPDTDSASLPAGYLAGREVALHGTVQDTPSRRGQLMRLRITATAAELTDRRETERYDVSGDAIAWVYPTSYELNPGDRVTLSGIPDIPVPVDDADSPPDQQQATRSFGDDLVILMRPHIRLIERAPPPMRLLNSVRDQLRTALERNLPSPQAELARALLLGQRDDLPSDISDTWQRAGTAHLLAISGLHVSVMLGVTLLLSVMAFGRQRGLYVLLPLAAIWLYAVLSGLNPPVVRAAMMGSIYLGAIASGRQPSGGLALILAAAALALWDPQVMTTASFQMTVAAMAGIVFLTDPLRRLMGITPEAQGRETGALGGLRHGVLTGVAASLGAVIGIKPLLLHYFGVASLFTIPASLLGTAALPIVLLASMTTAVGGVLLDGSIANALGWAAWPFLTFLLALASFFAAPPFAAITVPPLPVEWVVQTYLIMAILFLTPILRSPSGLLGPVVSLPSMSIPNPRRLLTSWPIVAALALALATAGFGAAAPYMNDRGHLKVHILDIGQGDSILVESPTGRRVLIDGGPDGTLLQQRLAEHLPWWSRRIDVVVLTHPSADHVIGLTETIQRYDVGYVIDPQLESGTVYGRLWEEALEANPELIVMRAERGMTMDLGGGAYFEIIHPPHDRPFDIATKHDDNSVVSRLSLGDVSFLLTADIYAPAEKYLLESGVDLQATVLKIAHQGSRYSSGEDFLRAVSPQVAVVSAGEDNRFNHPHPETLGRLSSLTSAPTILRTDRDGTVTLTTDGKTLEWSTGS